MLTPKVTETSRLSPYSRALASATASSASAAVSPRR
jgi:hypothetical protein